MLKHVATAMMMGAQGLIVSDWQPDTKVVFVYTFCFGHITEDVTQQRQYEDDSP